MSCSIQQMESEMQMRWVAVVCVVGLSGAAESARGALISYSKPIESRVHADLTGSGSQVVPADDLKISRVLTQFDPSLGVLNSATITFTTSYELDFNTGTEADNEFVTIGGSFYLAGQAYGGRFVDLIRGGPAGSEFDLESDLTNTTQFTATFRAEIFDQLTGTGTVPFLFDESDDATVKSFNGGFARFSRLGGGSVAITYDYTPVPEPVSVLWIGGTALGMVRRRRRAE